jgi:Fe-S-cluster-containing hydrogenase component 2
MIQKTKVNEMGLFSKRNTSNYQDKTLMVVKSRCPQNHPCPSIRVCPTGALVQSGYAAPTVDQDKCIKCGKCTGVCPRGALQFQ